MLRATWRWIASRLFAAPPGAPLAVTIANTARGVEIAWTRAPRAGAHNVDAEEHAVSVRCVDRAVLHALDDDNDGWMDVYVGDDDSFVLEGIGEGLTLEARARSENARGASAWTYAPTSVRTAKVARATAKGEGEDEGDGDDAWGAQWGRPREVKEVA